MMTTAFPATGDQNEMSATPGPELLPCASVYPAGGRVRVEVRGVDGPGRLTAWHLGDPVRGIDVESDGVVDLGELPPGGYLVEFAGARTAVDVTTDARSVLRYGFVADFRPGRDVAAVRDNLRRLHLTGVQFYDWAYRHADLLGGGTDYLDALGQPVSLDTVRSLVAVCHEIGSDALGYAAVYAVGPQEWPAWEHDALLTAEGSTYALGDFLFLVDPAAEDWLLHFISDLDAAVTQVGFDGFHLDQYGYPKRALRADGYTIDLADSFPRMIGGARTEFPAARLVFNNVNDFPTWATAEAPQDAVYIEVWKPQVGLEHLAQTATRARALAGGKPVVIAAYQHVYESVPAGQADLSASFTMATLFSHGVTHLLAGEADRILTDPYYVRNHQVAPSTEDLLRRYYDFAVAYSELLFDPALVDVTSSVVSDYNGDIDVVFQGYEVDQIARPGLVWRRVAALPDGRYVMHLINLTGQHDTAWDAPRQSPVDPGPATLTVRRTGPGMPRVRLASPDADLHLRDVPLTANGEFATGVLPAPAVWQLLLIDPSPRATD